MKTAKIIALILFIPLGLLGQSIPTLTLDSLVRTSEYYSGRYDEERNEHTGTYWFLDYDFKLYFGRPSHHPPSDKRELVGSWELQKDSLVTNVSSPKKIGLSSPVNFKYKIYQISWATNTGFTEKDSGEPLILTSVGIILSDSALKTTEILEKLNRYVEGHFKPTKLKKEEEPMGDWENHDQVGRLVREYFNIHNVIIGIKHYKNKNLWIR